MCLQIKQLWYLGKYYPESILPSFYNSILIFIAHYSVANYETTTQHTANYIHMVTHTQLAVITFSITFCGVCNWFMKPALLHLFWNTLQSLHRACTHVHFCTNLKCRFGWNWAFALQVVVEKGYNHNRAAMTDTNFYLYTDY